MRKTAAILCLMAVGACAKHDPILPGARTAIFDVADVSVLNQPVPNLPGNPRAAQPRECPYTQDSDNTLWDGTRKIFSGFATKNFVRATHTPVCSGGYVYAGLTTGEVVKIAPKTREIMWISDVYRPNNMTGGSWMLDIIAPVVVDGGNVYAGGLGDAFCKINAATGDKKWCADIAVATPFTVVGNVAYVVATDANLYAIRTSDGAAYWRTSVGTQDAPQYENGVVTVGAKRIDAATGELI